MQTKELVMNQANVKVSFYLKKSEADADGNCPVMAKYRKILGSGIQCEDESFTVALDFRTCVRQEYGCKGNKQPSGRDSCNGFKYLLRTVGCT